VYNEERYLEEMISSVQAQTLENWELLFVDDGSSDGTCDIIAEASRQDRRISLVAYGEKLGKVRAFNQAYARSRGLVVVMVSGDDRLSPDSLRVRFDAVAHFPTEEPAVGYFKLRTFSTNRKFDGMVLPRGTSTSRSGGSIAMNRALAQLLFPIDESLMSEDIWLGYASVDLAQHEARVPRVVLEYRIHDANSNPRQLAFDQMNEAMHDRYEAWPALLRCQRLSLSPACVQLIETLQAVEVARYHGNVGAIVRAPLPLADRLAMASTASPLLYRIRSRYYRLFSGWRGQ